MAAFGTLAVGLGVDAHGRFATPAGVLALAVLGGVPAVPVGVGALVLDVVVGGLPRLRFPTGVLVVRMSIARITAWLVNSGRIS